MMRSVIKKMLCLLLVVALLPLPGARASTAGCTSEEARDNYLSFVKKNLFRDFIEQEIILDAVESGAFSGSYAFRDLDQDGVDDLVLWLGAGASEGELMTFTMYENAILYTGSIPCLGIRPQVLCADHDTDIIVAEIYHGDVFAYSCRIINYRLKVISEDVTVPMRWKEITWVGDLPVSAATSDIPSDAPAPDAPAPDAPAKGTPAFAPTYQGQSRYSHLFDSYSDFISKQGFAYFLEQDIFRYWAMGMTEQTYYYEDMDNDGSEELIIWIQCDYITKGEMLIFSMHNGHPDPVPGTFIQDARPSFSGSRSDPGLLIVCNFGGMESITQCIYEDGRLYFDFYTPTDNSWYALTD